MTDYYELLGVGRGASPDEIKRAYRQLARQLHPDANPDDPAAEARFKEVAVAYETLSDPQRRQQYDRYGESGSQGGSPFNGGGGFGDIFDMFFNGSSPFGGTQQGPSGPPRGSDLEVVLDLEFDEAVFGTAAPVSVRTAVACDECEGSGAETGSGPVTCPECNGAGQVRRVRQSILGQMVTAGPCGRCSGFGSIIANPCGACSGEGRIIDEASYTVDVPAGVDTGATLRLSGRGAVGQRRGAAGDLYVHIRVADHPRFVRHNDDLVHEFHVPMTQAALGAQIPFETLDGQEIIPIDAGTQSGQVVRLRQKGVPHLQGRGRGDLLLQIQVDIPEALSAAELELLTKLAELRGEAIDPPEHGLMSKLRSAFK
jgi:molecular chaperone DnaJ